MLIRFLRDRGANVASIFALTLIPLLSATGAAVDYSYAFRLRTITQDALDAAALAGGRMIGVNTEAEIKTEVDKFFISNVANRLDTIPSVSQAISGATITLNTTLDVPTHFLKRHRPRRLSTSRCRRRSPRASAHWRWPWSSTRRGRWPAPSISDA